jgi:hypothetical protein
LASYFTFGFIFREHFADVEIALWLVEALSFMLLMEVRLKVKIQAWTLVIWILVSKLSPKIN